MNDSRLLQGLLITACIGLVVAIVFTVIDVKTYEVPAGARPAGPPAEASPPAEEPAETGEQPPGASLLELAPQETWGFFYVDAQKVMQIPAVQEKMAGSADPSVAILQEAREIAFFLLPAAGAGTAPTGGLVARAGAPGMQQLKQMIQQSASPVAMSGLEAYRVTKQAVSAARQGNQPAIPAMGGPQEAFIAFPDDSTMLAASSQADVQRLASAFPGGGVGSRLQQMAKPMQDSAFYGAVLPTQQMLQQAQLSGQGPIASELRALALGLDFEDELDVRTTLYMSGSQAAQQAAQTLRAQVNGMKQAMAQQMPSVAQTLDKLKVSNDAEMLHVNVALTTQELEQLMGQALAMAMMAGAQGGPMGGGPSGGDMNFEFEPRQ